MLNISESTCLYTGIFGGYEKLNELEGPVKKSKIKKICFTDDETLTSETWEIRLIKPAFPLDSVRSQRMVKVNAHKFLPEFRSSIYIDNTVMLTIDPLVLVDRFCKVNNISIPVHSYRDSVYQEFFEVADNGLDDSARIFEQLNHYQLIDADSLDRKPYWAGIIIRNHMNKDVISLMEEWYRNILRYSRRDQLSLVYSEITTGVGINKIVIDNLFSDFHRWPVVNKRDSAKRLWSPSLSGAMPVFEKIKKMKSIESVIDGKLSDLNLMNKDISEKYKPTRVPDGFDPQLYLAINTDVAEAGVDPKEHYLSHGWSEGRRWR
ncbi:DUF616 domain-containing protein [Erwinia tracheiphila]|uniref:DUF616 domain-containing protein n=1 Tax=Erwinia tracheiphila TaxID=65700 RepID=A0A345CTA5_9GAMM|nr:glycosyltransferase domain-containing protein [Erwinia tracheiphila]AXF76672.1 DUF616 domain-containing protein [Erwinia tracheiphila]UIA84652.1 DUF616 domain-containing protein [Erwinia tracheiphila]